MSLPGSSSSVTAMDLVLVVLLYALDERDLSLESDVYDIPARARPEQDPAPLL
jgi:hypothetical protein